jgi:hypothetical protein
MEFKENKAFLESQVPLACKACLVQQEQQVHVAQQAHRVLQALKVLQAHKVLLAHKVQVVQLEQVALQALVMALLACMP